MANDTVFEGYKLLQTIRKLPYRYNKRKLVYRIDKVKLYHYQPFIEKPHPIPVLVVFATVNRPEILDLIPESSFIGCLLQQGLDVYLLDWGYPTAEDDYLSLSDYVCDYLAHCVQRILKKSNLSSLYLTGICQGGLLSLCYAILYQNIKKLVLISAPIDFKTKENTISSVLSQVDVNALTRNGNIPGAWLSQFFVSLRPFELVGKKYLNFLKNLSDSKKTEKFLRVEKWLQDAPDQTVASFAELIQDLYHGNKLIQNKLYLNGKRVKLSQLKIPVLNIMAKEDEIVPVSASRCLKAYVKNYTERTFNSGHIGIYVSDRVGNKMTKSIARWLVKK